MSHKIREIENPFKISIDGIRNPALNFLDAHRLNRLDYPTVISYDRKSRIEITWSQKDYCLLHIIWNVDSPQNTLVEGKFFPPRVKLSSYKDGNIKRSIKRSRLKFNSDSDRDFRLKIQVERDLRHWLAEIERNYSHVLEDDGSSGWILHQN